MSVADAKMLLNFVNDRGHGNTNQVPGCGLAADFNQDDLLDWYDASEIMQHIVLGKSSPEPFDDWGFSVPVSDVPCETQEGGAPLNRPDSRMEILDAFARGGASRKAVITVLIFDADNLCPGCGGNTHGTDHRVCRPDS